MKFYTNVTQRYDKILVRGYDNGKRYSTQVDYQPTLYVPSKKNTDFKTLDGKYVQSINPGTPEDCRQFYKKYSDVDGFEIYGMDNYIFQYISDEYPETKIEYDFSKIKLYTIDIEVSSESGFPSPLDCAEEILSITLQDFHTKHITCFGVKPYNNTRDDVDYILCDGEIDLCYKFLNFWESDYPDILTGWNCVPTSSNIWESNKITKIKNIKCGDILYDSYVKTVFPKSIKNGVKQKLANGANVISSYDHIFPYTLCNPDVYTKFSKSKKSKSYTRNMTVSEAIKSQDEKFVFVPLRKNTNLDNPNLSLNQCYLLGLIYTDGTLKNKNKLNEGFTFYQSDLSFIEEVKLEFNIPSKIVGPYKNCYHLHIPTKTVNNIELIYNLNKKNINLELLSTLSERQFYMFLSGLLDGDGYVSGNTISLCNYNDDILDLYELFLWNGIFSTISNDERVIRLIDIDFEKLTLMKTKRWDKGFNFYNLIRSSSNKSSKIKFKKTNGGYLVRVDKFEELNEMEMMDIETNTNYFISSGVKTHNCSLYDVPYIVGRFTKILGEKDTKRLSPWGRVSSKELDFSGRPMIVCDLLGIANLDYLELYKKFTYVTRERYSLDYIGEVELGEKKLDHSEYETFKDFYTKDWNKFLDYNIQDVMLVDKLEQKLKLIELAVMMAFNAKVNFADVFFQVRMWDAITFNYLKAKNIIIPPRNRIEKDEKFTGAYVKEPKPGIYEYVVSFDLASLYPSLIMMYSVSPETLVTKDDLNMRIKELESML